MRVGILGSGEVGRALAAGFVARGDDVVIGTRDAAKLTDWVADHVGVGVTTVPEAAAHGDVVVLAVRGAVAEQVLRNAGESNLAGKPVIDTTNPIADAPPVNGTIRYFTGPDESLMERLQAAFPTVGLVKAFNSVGSPLMVGPDLPGGPPTMFVCGNDGDAKEVVRRVLVDFGWDVVDLGAVEAARAIEPLCILWCLPGFVDGTWSHAVKLLR